MIYKHIIHEGLIKYYKKNRDNIIPARQIPTESSDDVLTLSVWCMKYSQFAYCVSRRRIFFHSENCKYVKTLSLPLYVFKS